MRITILLLIPVLLFAQPIEHFKTEDGIEIPTPKPILENYKNQQKIIDDAVSKFYNDLKDRAQKAPKPEPPEGKELFPCTKSKSFSDKGMRGANFDVLIVEKGKVPPEPKVTLGARVIIMPYNHSDYSLAHTLVEDFNVNCLPTRIRIVDGKVSKLEGDKAYLSFEKSEKGEEHPFIKNWRKAK